MPGEDKILITSNDSRIRLYDLRDLSLVCKYKGYTNVSSQIKACFSPDGRYITSGSENQCVFLWSTNHVPQVSLDDATDVIIASNDDPILGHHREKRQEQLLRGHQGPQRGGDLLPVRPGALPPAGGAHQGQGGGWRQGVPGRGRGVWGL